MKIIVCCVMVLCIFFTAATCYALSIHDNGHEWKAASEEAKIAVAEELSKMHGKHYMWWVGAFDAFYNTADENILEVSITNAANMLPYFDER